MPWPKIIALGAAVILGVLVPTARSQVAIESWTVDQGLPQNIVRGVCQTPDGYLWLATFAGLVRFDGVRFTTFDRSNTPGIKGNRFSALACSQSGEIWAGTEGSGLTHYKAGRFRTYTSRDGLLSDDIAGITCDRKGGVWVLAQGRLHKWQPSPERFFPLEAPENQYAAPLGFDAESGMWNVDDRSLYVFRNGQRKAYPLPATWPRGVPGAAGLDLGRNIWLTAYGAPLLSLVKGQWSSIAGERTPKSGVRDLKMNTDYRDSRGQLWHGELRIAHGIGPTAAIEVPTTTGTVKVEFSDLLEDREGNIWLSTDGRGLLRLHRQVMRVYSEGLPDRNVYNVYQSRDGTLWFGTWRGGLFRMGKDKNRIYSTSDGLISNRIACVYEDRAGVLWVAVQNALYRLKHDRLEAVRDTPFPADAFGTRTMYQDSTGAMWFGGSAGLWRLKDNCWTRFTKSDGLATEDVRVIIPDRTDHLWVGGYGGLSYVAEHGIRHWTEQDGLPSNMIRALYRDREGALWIGTYDGGLGRYKDGKFTIVSEQHGLANNGVFQILEDDHSNLWMSCNRGIYRVSKRELNDVAEGRAARVASIAFGRSDGLLNPECNGGFGPAGLKSLDGRLWFATQDGVASIRPEDLGSTLPAPPVVIESCLLDRSLVSTNTPVRVTPGHSDIEIQYTALSLIKSNRIRFRYKLQGLDADWINAAGRRTAYYSHLPPGSYVFSVTAAHEDGAWTQAAATLPLVVLPPFYRTSWFLTLSLSLLLLTIWIAWRRRIHHLEHAQLLHREFSRQLIASQEMERKRLASELHDSLGQRLIIIKNLALLLLHSSSPGKLQPFQRERVEEIESEVTGAVHEVKEISYNLRPYRLDRLGLTAALQAMIDTASSVSETRFAVELDNIDNILPKEAEINFYRIVQECTNNVLKHSGARSAFVCIRRNGVTLQMTVRDDGHGFLLNADAGQSHLGGFGLTGISERAELLGGKAVIQSSPGQGATVSVDIRLTSS